MSKVKIGSIRQTPLVEGDVNLLKKGEILVTHSEGYTVLRKRTATGELKTFVVVPLEELTKEEPKVEPEVAPEETTEEAETPKKKGTKDD